ncbi:MAG: envelope stress response membrane protein PspC [Woeseia sp.]
MTAYASIRTRRFYRNRDKAVLGGVCAGLADYFGFNLKVTRILVVIAFFMATPMTIAVYIATVLLVPSAPDQSKQEGLDPDFRRALRSSPSQTLGDVRRRFQSLDSRLARLERYVTSSRFKLDQEFKNL